MRIKLSDHFTFKKLFIFTVPSIAMMIFTSIYGIVDGYFVSNYAGDTAFAAVNFIMPFLMILGAVGFMFGAGGSALVAKTLGEGNREKANSVFSLIVYTSAILGIIIAVFGIIFVKDVAYLLGADDAMAEICDVYSKVVLIALPFFLLQYEFQSFFIVAEKPTLGLIVTLISGFANMILDFLFVGVFGWGVVGAAAATAASQFFGGAIPLIYFFAKNNSLLRLGRAELDVKALLKTCGNGSSEFVSNISMSFVSMLYNYQLMKYIGEDGVSAYGTFMYIGMIFVAIFIGYSSGIAPVFGYNLGADNREELHNVFKKSVLIIGVFSVLMLILAEFLAMPLSKLFVGYNDTLFEITERAIAISSGCFLFSGIGIFASSLFTALNNGLISAVISFLRTIVFQSASVLILPLVFGVKGIWISVIVADFAAAVVAVIFIVAKRKKYGY